MYKGVFEMVAASENKYSEDGQTMNFPSFGNSTTGYDRLKEFYGFWSAFSSRMSFGWKEKYNPAEVTDPLDL